VYVVLKIISVKSFLFHPGEQKHWLFVKIETDENITGWGECYTHLDRDRNIVQFIDELERYIIGRDPFNIKSFTYFAYVDFAKKRGSLDFFSAVSGIEMAMWDIVGKALQTPVYRLLGGAYKEKLRVYVNGWESGIRDLKDLGDRAVQAVKRGFSALKLDPMPDVWSMFLSREDIKYTIDRVRAVREAVGPDIDLLVDAHRRMAPHDALYLVVGLTC
jgi:galactonate dehydratase